MKRLSFVLGLCIALLAGCSGSGTRYRNPYLPNYAFSVDINTNLPLYSGLKSAINPIIIPDNGYGVTLIAMKVSDTDYRIWDAYCPNQAPTSCSLMDIDGVNAVCSCESFSYSLFTGDGAQGEYTMKPYRYSVLGNGVIRIYN